ncbi:MAG: hypothetical protein IJ657_00735 [Acidaminococcaceae bacterium]|nr:hypothetical protein [Acidaminococcaceae bacterium]
MTVGTAFPFLPRALQERLAYSGGISSGKHIRAKLNFDLSLLTTRSALHADACIKTSTNPRFRHDYIVFFSSSQFSRFMLFSPDYIF